MNSQTNLTNSDLYTILDLVQQEYLYFKYRPQLIYRTKIMKDLKKLELKIIKLGELNVRQMP